MRKLFMVLLTSSAFLFAGSRASSQVHPASELGISRLAASTNAAVPPPTAHPEYVLDPSHPAYPTGNTFSGDPEFLRGWCFAWDATSPVVQSGSVIKLFRRTISMGGPDMVVAVPVAYGFGSDGFPNTTINVTIKFGYGFSLEMVNQAAPNTSLFFENALGIRDYADQLPDEEKRFWYGYAGCLEMAGQNPYFLYIKWGMIM